MPVLLSYCATFLKPEMLHVYRQVTGIQAYEHIVVTRRRENPDLFPYPSLIALRKSPWRFLRRAWYRLRRQPVPLDGRETRQILDLIARRKVDVLHAYFGTEAARMPDILRQARCAKVVSFHGADLSESMRQEDFEFMLRHVDLFLARSESLAEALEQRGCPRSRIRLSRTGVPVPEQAAKQPPLPDGPVRMLQACRFIEKKGLDVSIRATAALRARGIDARLDLAGGGPLENDLRALAEELGLTAYVRFLGFLDSATLLNAMPGYHFFLHPSRTTASGDREGIPNAMLEAMACGLVVFATRHSGIPEAVTHLQNGVLIERADTALLEKEIAALLATPQRIPELAGNARDTVINRFSTAANRHALEAIYAEAIAISRQYAGQPSAG